MKRGMKPDDLKRKLSFEEALTVAWSYYVRHVDQQTLAAMYGVNSGRISEACIAVRQALSRSRADASEA